jgi:hypothetical protein
VDFITFTGSTRVGAEIKAASGLRRVALELGGTGQTIVHADGDIDAAAPLCARNAMRVAGQSCISVQNVYAHESVYARFVDRLAEEIRRLKVGDPLDPDTDVGTLIDVDAAKRVELWVTEAVAGGARALTGAKRTGAQFEPTLLVDVDPAMKVVCNEVFGPVVSVQRYSDLEYDARRYTRLFRPQSLEAVNPSLTIWTPREERAWANDGIALALWDGDAMVDTLPRTPYRVAQLPGASRGYVIEEFAPKESSTLEPDFYAMRVRHEAEITRIGLLVDGAAGDPLRASTRQVRKIDPPADALLFLPALLPLVIGLGLRVRWKRLIAGRSYA